MFDNIKEQSHEAVTKVIESVTKYQQQQDLSNPEGPTEEVLCSQLIDVHSHSLQQSEKMLISMIFRFELESKFSHQQFKERLIKIQKQMKMQENEFKQQSKPKVVLNTTNKAIRTYKKKQVAKEGPNVQSHPQYYRIDQEICNKIFNIYRRLSVGIPDTGLNISFEDKQRYKQCMNYHKVLEIMKDAGISLQIHQKLQILRSIKKFCMNANFITSEQFVKVFKVIVHGLGYKEKLFYALVDKKSVQISLQKQYRSKNRSRQETRKRNYKFKTQGSSVNDRSIQDRSVRRNLTKIGEIHQIRKNTQSDIKSRILQNVKAMGDMGRKNSKKGYLVKAMQAEKISKITWQSLFNMNESTMHHNIVIPQIVRGKNIKNI